MVPCWDCFMATTGNLIKNRLEEEFLTSQSKEEKERNAEKKEERKVKTTESEI